MNYFVCRKCGYNFYASIDEVCPFCENETILDIQNGELTK